MFWSVAMAQAAGEAAKPSMLETLFPFLAVLVVFYFVFSRPQQKKLKQHQDFLGNLKRGDQVVTSSGIFGSVTGINPNFVTLEVADNVRLKILKSQISGPVKDATNQQ